MVRPTKPLLSIGIIFKNDIRSIARCLKALDPIRKAVPCELVMADTGSDDGSRAVAEEYADILFDFPWINDFSAARNAVMDRCSGVWYLTVDTDEYMDEDLTQILGFLHSKEQRAYNSCLVVQRNYGSYEMEDGEYTDFLAVRMLRMSTGLRYQGAIHEKWCFSEECPSQMTALRKLILHHDGYVGLGSEQGKAKRERNLKLLRQELEQEPDDLMRLMQYIESGGAETDYMDRLRHALDLIREKHAGWNYLGAPIFRYAIFAASSRKLPELEEWIEEAEERFPDSYFTRIDVALAAAVGHWEKKEYAECVRRGEALRQAYQDFRAGRGEIMCTMHSTVANSSPNHEHALLIMLVNAYLENGQPEKIPPVLKELDYACRQGKKTGDLIKTLWNIQQKSWMDTTELVNTIWDNLTAPEPDQKTATERGAAFYTLGAVLFPSTYRENELGEEYFCRHAYTALVPLAGKCELGTAAAILESEVPEEIEQLLHTVERWSDLPGCALCHALACGVQFPLPDQVLKIEEMDVLALHIAQEQTDIVSMLETMPEDSSGLQQIMWMRGLVLAGVQTCKWQDEEQGLVLARRFAEIELKFLETCYHTSILQPENLCVLSEMHRLGWYCAQAFQALDAGELSTYIHWLREGVTSCGGMRSMVEFLMEHTPEMKVLAPSQELLELAEKVRTLLAAYAPDDPAVAVLKQSPAYQKVAYLIEGTEAPVMGGLLQ